LLDSSGIFHHQRTLITVLGAFWGRQSGRFRAIPWTLRLQNGIFVVFSDPTKMPLKIGHNCLHSKGLKVVAGTGLEPVT
jgi:hypothetical protein